MVEPIFFGGTVIDFTFLRVMLALGMFASASYFDLKKREVSDLLWMVFAGAAGILYVFDFPSTLSEGITIVISMGITAAAAYGIYRAGLFGGADMLALITLSGILPVYHGSLLGIYGISIHSLAPLIVLTNAVLLSVAGVIFNIARNVVYYSKHAGKLFEGLHDRVEEHSADDAAGFPDSGDFIGAQAVLKLFVGGAEHGNALRVGANL